ncbi:hypothetical protein H2200_008708 [Cladophialophora chaetospira]|uniref:BZIP domain-containing protein n=1 Tax=Cladophialophora chaetospira TaxID=386627 RepID=A0AA39CFY7_9EURO|nr:hypothetical protein H2200_008708 [Cladophialophora chaetospira]
MAHNLDYFDLQLLDSWITGHDLYPSPNLLSLMKHMSTWHQLQDQSQLTYGPLPMLPGQNSRKLSEDIMSSPSSSDSLESYMWSIESPPPISLRPTSSAPSKETERRLRRQQQNRRAQRAYRTRRETHVNDLRSQALEWQKKHENLSIVVVKKNEEITRLRDRIKALEIELQPPGESTLAYSSSSTETFKLNPFCGLLESLEGYSGFTQRGKASPGGKGCMQQSDDE